MRVKPLESSILKVNANSCRAPVRTNVPRAGLAAGGPQRPCSWAELQGSFVLGRSALHLSGLAWTRNTGNRHWNKCSFS